MAEPSQNTDTEKPCEICGAVGYVELLQICSKCDLSHEHRYCMKRTENEAMDPWICEECDLGNLTLSPKPGPSLVPGELHDSRWPREKIKQPLISAKVKYISPEEVIGLGSVSNTNNAESRPISVSNSARSLCYTSKRSTQTPPSCRQPQTLGRNSTIPSSPSPSRLNQMSKGSNISAPDKRSTAAPSTPGKQLEKIDRLPSGTYDSLFISSAPKILEQSIGQTKLESKSLKLEAVARSMPVKEVDPVVNRGLSVPSSRTHDLPVGGSGKKGTAKRMKSLDELADRAPSVALLENNDQAITSSGKRKTPEVATQKRVEEATARTHFPTSSSKKDEPVGTSGVIVSDSSYRRNLTSQGTEQLDPLLRFDRRLPNHPAVHATWRGNFRVIGDSPRKFDGIRAHPASKVHINAYEFSKKMPEVLQFEFHPRGNFWGDIFEGDIPDGLDIGLYFFPRPERAREIYALLVEHIEMHDYVLRCSMGEVELLITTSKHLHRDSQRINNSHFLWGFFHESATEEVPLKDKENMDDSEVVDMDTDMSGGENVVRDPCISSSDCGQPMMKEHQSSDLVPCESVDMEVDMLGGQTVGKVDVVVPMPSEQLNLTGQPMSQVECQSTEGNLLFIPRVISTGSFRQSKVDSHRPPPVKQGNHCHRLLSKVKTECIEEGILSPPTVTSVAPSNSAIADVLCKLSNISRFASLQQAPPGFTKEDKVKTNSPAAPTNLTPTARLGVPINSSPLACIESAPLGFSGADKIGKGRMSIPPVPSKLTPTAVLCTPSTSSPSACIESAPPGFTEADRVKNTDRSKNSVTSSPNKAVSTAIKSESLS